MEDAENHSAGTCPSGADTARAAEQLMRQVHDELKSLLHQRAEIMKRIGTAKKTIAGLAALFGDSVVNSDVLQLVDGRPATRTPGLTGTCRAILMEADRALSAAEMRERIKERAPSLLDRQKDPICSITTILNRLVHYGEVERVSLHNGRAWQWVAESGGDQSIRSTRPL